MPNDFRGGWARSSCLLVLVHSGCRLLSFAKPIRCSIWISGRIDVPATLLYDDFIDRTPLVASQIAGLAPSRFATANVVQGVPPIVQCFVELVQIDFSSYCG